MPVHIFPTLGKALLILGMLGAAGHAQATGAKRLAAVPRVQAECVAVNGDTVLLSVPKRSLALSQSRRGLLMGVRTPRCRELATMAEPAQSGSATASIGAGGPGRQTVAPVRHRLPPAVAPSVSLAPESVVAKPFGLGLYPFGL